jgi:hypothetical protein
MSRGVIRVRPIVGEVDVELERGREAGCDAGLDRADCRPGVRGGDGVHRAQA